MEALNHEKDVSIDPHGLDTEWMRQPGLFLKYSRLEAEETRTINHLKEQLEVAEGVVRLEIIAKPSAFTTSAKPNLDEIKSLIANQPPIQKLKEELRESQYNLDILKAAVRAIDQKKHALQDLVKLLLGNYFAGPQAPRDLAAEWEKKVEQHTSKSIAKKRMRKEKQ